MTTLDDILARCDSDFKEADHPRDQDGKFGSGGGGGGKSNVGGKGGKVARSMLKDVRERSQARQTSQVIKDQGQFKEARQELHDTLISEGYTKVSDKSPSTSESYSIYEKGDERMEVNTRSRRVEQRSTSTSYTNNSSEYVITVRKDTTVVKKDSVSAADVIQSIQAPPMIHAAGIMFCTPGGKVLLCRRTDNTGWAYPGGGIEDGETPEVAARRECHEETGLKYDGPLALWTRRIKDGCDFTTFLATAEEFEPKLNPEHDQFTWVDRSFALGGDAQHLHPGVRTALMRFDMDELGIAKAIRAGELTSPQPYSNVMLVALRITGTGAAYRKKIDEYVWRDPSLYLNQEFLDRCNGLPVIWEHPDSNLLNSEEFANRIIGTVLLPYIDGDEVWGIAKIYDKSAADIMQGDELSTSPGVFLESQAKYKMTSGEKLIIEGKAKIIDHIAICQVGVWDKGGKPAGVSNDATNSTVGVIAMPEEVKTDSAGLANNKEGDKLDLILKHLDSAHTKIDSFGARMDSFEKFKKDSEESALKKEREENDLKKNDKKKADADEEAKKKADADLQNKEQEKTDKAKKDADEEERKKTDSAITARLDDLAKRIPVELPEADRARLVEVQSRAERVAQAFGDSAPRWTNSESEVQYRARLASKFKAHSKDWKDVDLSALGADVLAVAETRIYADAWEAAVRPATVEGGILREVTETDRTGRKITRFYGDTEVCWAPFKQPARMVTGWNTKFNH